MDDQTLENIRQVTGYNPKELKRETGEFQFSDVAYEIDRLFDFVKDLKRNDDFYKSLPETQKTDLRNYIAQVNDIFSRIKNYRPTELPNPQEARNELAQQVRNLYQSLFTILTTFEVYSLQTSGSQSRLSETSKEAQRILTDAQNALEKINDIMQSAQKTTSKITLYKYLNIFKEVSDNHNKQALIWLIVSVMLAGVLLFLMWFISNEISQDIEKLNSIQGITSVIVVKLFFIAIAIYLLQQSVRNYMANMHLKVLNSHRENVLKVFDAMYKSATTKETGDQILSYLSKAIFDSGETGFFPGKEVVKDGPDITQVFKDIAKGK